MQYLIKQMIILRSKNTEHPHFQHKHTKDQELCELTTTVLKQSFLRTLRFMYHYSEKLKHNVTLEQLYMHLYCLQINKN